ncbi:hypothetical protein NARC_80133 [Candidatus Nitrosocosmicus arcticus]|uniref:Uncharacterized protein n=1 Tax=Candidatus Nitrosocosmicus arcticus TaxID=2035267 RepID=A0A557SUX3_9ARCH|nr:hypothetical protein NARC_80133 [Candidatus Nitrosocosmicus arcticus]
MTTSKKINLSSIFIYNGYVNDRFIFQLLSNKAKIVLKYYTCQIQYFRSEK